MNNHYFNWTADHYHNVQTEGRYSMATLNYFLYCQSERLVVVNFIGIYCKTQEAINKETLDVRFGIDYNW